MWISLPSFSQFSVSLCLLDLDLDFSCTLSNIHLDPSFHSISRLVVFTWHDLNQKGDLNGLAYSLKKRSCIVFLELFLSALACFSLFFLEGPTYGILGLIHNRSKVVKGGV